MGLKFCISYWCPHDSVEFAKGEVVGAGEFVVGTAKAVTNPAGFVEGLVNTCSSGYASEAGGFDGALQCIDNLDPFAGFVNAFQAGCPEQAGEDVGGSLAAVFATLAGGAEASESGAASVGRGWPEPPGYDPQTWRWGQASRSSVSGENLWDPSGGEWRWHPADKWHDAHWDYNAHDAPKGAPWQRIYPGGGS